MPKKITGSVFISLFLLCLLSIWSSTFAKSDSDRPTFIEDSENGTLVIWSDLTVPENKSYTAIVVMSGHLEMAGAAEHLIVVGGSVHLLPTAKVTNGMNFLGGRVIQEKGAEIGRDEPLSGPGVMQKLKNWWSTKKDEWFPKPSEDNDWKWSLTRQFSPAWWSWRVIYFASFLVLLCALFFALLLAPQVAGKSSDQLLEHPFYSLLVGFLLWMLWFPVLVLLILSIVGILFVPFYLLFSLIAVVGGFLTSAVALGRLILKNSRQTFVPAILGFVILFVVAAIPILGHGVFGLATLIGSGAVIGPRFYRLR